MASSTPSESGLGQSHSVELPSDTVLERAEAQPDHANKNQQTSHDEGNEQTKRQSSAGSKFNLYSEFSHSIGELATGAEAVVDDFDIALDADLDSEDDTSIPLGVTDKTEFIECIRSLRTNARRPVVDRAKYIFDLERQVLQQIQELSFVRFERDTLRKQLKEASGPSDEGSSPYQEDNPDTASTQATGAENTKMEPTEAQTVEPEHIVGALTFGWTKWSYLQWVERARWSVVEALVERPRSFAYYQPTMLASRHKRKLPTEPKGPSFRTENDIERIRINSPHLQKVFQSLLGKTAPPADHSVYLKPFKIMVCYEETLQDILVTLRKESQMRSRNGLVATESGHAKLGNETDERAPQLDGLQTPRRDDETSRRRWTPWVPDSEDDNDQDDSSSDKSSEPEIELAPSPEMISHLEFLLKYINEGLKPHMSNYRRLRARDVKKVAFKDLWYLFAPGDKVYDASAKQAFQVVGVRGGRALLSKSEDDDDRIKVASENDYAVEDLGPFIIDCFYLGFNGEELGPVNHSVRILPYDGEQAISNLRLYPLEYARMKVDVDDVAGDIPMEEHLSRRGQKFVAFLNPHEVAHREYVGFSVGNVREQIDSRVIIDMALYYEAHPDDQPTLGLMRPPEADRREIEERKTCRCPDCSGRRNIHIYDDRHVDSQRTNEFIAANSKNWRLIRDATGKLTPDQLSLLPAKAYGYVLRTRKWYELDVDKIMEVEQKPENFQDLVLPKMYKQLVEGMVRTHSRSVKPNASGKDETTQVQGNDLVRGKGKGVIILLHGVPGVGKTSTAECVAEYTSRPLFAITCGDIGENPQQVEQNLEENFQLAHRWGCVMLLDEADVFLQTRNKQDMQRNAVVSVFLRILEYYSGILFLTTNKVGTFDEAFKSRIHLSLYYPPLNDDQTKAIWEVNLVRLKRYHPGLDIEDRSIMTWVKSLIRERERDNFRPWNGRQIHNACQTAASIALFQDEGKLTLEHFEIVSQASMAFDQYLRDVHGTDDSGRAKRAQDRDDQFWDNQLDYEHGFESSSRRDKDNYISFGRRREHRQYGMADDRYQSDSEDGGHRLSQYARHSRDEPGYSYTQGSQRSNRRPQHAERMPGQDRQDSRRRRRRLPSLDRPISGWESDSDLQDSRRGDRPDLPTRNPKRHNTFED